MATYSKHKLMKLKKYLLLNLTCDLTISDRIIERMETFYLNRKNSRIIKKYNKENKSFVKKLNILDEN